MDDSIVHYARKANLRRAVLFNRRIYVALIISLSMRRQTEAACQ